jgi:signal transduction histidine kinase
MVLDMATVAVRAAQDAARSLGAEDRLEVSEAGEPVMVWGSVGPLELAVGNLVRNAIEASPPDGVVHFSIEVGTDWAEIRVRDSGPGVSEDIGDKVFEPFFTTKTERGGTGLGLAITRDMIAQLGGEIGLENSEHGGACATIRLQRWQETEPSS